MQRTLSKLPLAAAVALAAILTAVPHTAVEAKPPPAWSLETLALVAPTTIAEAKPPPARDAEFQIAHSGGMAKDGCHRDRKAGERHHHKDGSVERAGPCLKIDGRTWRFAGNAVCAAERAAMARDEGDGWGIDWQRHAKALKRCILRIRSNPRR